MKAFLLKLLLLILATAAVDLAWIFFMPVEQHIPYIWQMIAFFAIMTALFHFLSLKASRGKPQMFIRFYMGATAARLLVYMLVIFLYRFHDKSTLTPFALGFMAHYFLFTAFEVPVLLKELRKE